jgi:hypothetical protein
MAQGGDDPTLGEENGIFYFGLGEKRALQTVVMVAEKFSLSRILSIR